MGGDEGHAPPVGTDRGQGTDGLVPAAEPLVARAALRRRARADDPAAPHAGRDGLPDRLRLRRPPSRRRHERGAVESFELHDGLSVSEFDERLHATLARLGVDVAIREVPFGVPVTTPFADDREHAAYDRDAVERFSRSLAWTEWVFEEFAGWYCGKTSPVHLFWHSFDLAVTRFGAKRAPVSPDADPVTQEAYSHELVSFGFWAGDENVREPTYYSYTAPEPAGLRQRPLEPAEARWVDQGSGSLAILAYDAVRSSPDPRATLLAFLESAYRAGAGASGWDTADLASSWCPDPPRSETP